MLAGQFSGAVSVTVSAGINDPLMLADGTLTTMHQTQLRLDISLNAVIGGLESSKVVRQIGIDIELKSGTDGLGRSSGLRYLHAQRRRTGSDRNRVSV
ncbi:MAG: hypothetical protein MO846_06265 [Candidatus Devosia symbiotica]|nr:hypothetical protein [Candidatus Devosia symbiotica]